MHTRISRSTAFWERAYNSWSYLFCKIFPTLSLYMSPLLRKCIDKRRKDSLNKTQYMRSRWMTHKSRHLTGNLCQDIIQVQG